VGAEWELLLRVALAAALGGVVGYDRELRAKPAGLRTHMLVALGSALFAGTAILLIKDSDIGDDAGVADITRVVAAVATGVGFLGAGSILMARGQVHGLTTAANVWATAAMGTMIGLGYFIVGVGAAVLIVLTTAVLLLIEKRLIARGLIEVERPPTAEPTGEAVDVADDEASDQTTEGPADRATGADGRPTLPPD
jgi:putative Mg2+ transporter-C (MgtC) family protein